MDDLETSGDKMQRSNQHDGNVPEKKESTRRDKAKEATDISLKASGSASSLDSSGKVSPLQLSAQGIGSPKRFSKFFDSPRSGNGSPTNSPRGRSDSFDITQRTTRVKVPGYGISDEKSRKQMIDCYSRNILNLLITAEKYKEFLKKYYQPLDERSLLADLKLFLEDKLDDLVWTISPLKGNTSLSHSSDILEKYPLTESEDFESCITMFEQTKHPIAPRPGTP